MSSVESFVASVRWQYAKSMPDWPHEYTIKEWRPDLVSEFMAFCQVIETKGFEEPWPPPPASAIYCNRYLVVGDYKYWAMGPRGDDDPPEERTVINRVPWVIPTRRVDQGRFGLASRVRVDDAVGNGSAAPALDQNGDSCV